MNSLEAIQRRYPQAQAVSRYQVEINARGVCLRLSFPHGDLVEAGEARWGSARQRFLGGRVEQTSSWDDEDEPLSWESSFEDWAEAWFCCLEGGAIPGPGDSSTEQAAVP